MNRAVLGGRDEDCGAPAEMRFAEEITNGMEHGLGRLNSSLSVLEDKLASLTGMCRPPEPPQTVTSEKVREHFTAHIRKLIERLHEQANRADFILEGMARFI